MLQTQGEKVKQMQCWILLKLGKIRSCATFVLCEKQKIMFLLSSYLPPWA